MKQQVKETKDVSCKVAIARLRDIYKLAKNSEYDKILNKSYEERVPLGEAYTSIDLIPNSIRKLQVKHGRRFESWPSVVLGLLLNTPFIRWTCRKKYVVDGCIPDARDRDLYANVLLMSEEVDSDYEEEIEVGADAENEDDLEIDPDELWDDEESEDALDIETDDEPSPPARANMHNPTTARRYRSDDVICLSSIFNKNRYRVWRIINIHDSEYGEEATYELHPIDRAAGDKPIVVPVMMLDSHPSIRRG